MVYDNPDGLNQIIRQRSLSPLFQPIFNLQDQNIYGYEALIRGPSDSPLHSPLTLFETAERFHKLIQVEQLAHDVSVSQFTRMSLPGKLFLNISPVTFLEASYNGGAILDIIKHSDIQADKVIIEISEQYPFEDYELIKQATQFYKNLGFEIAIDDLGAGYAGLRSWSEIRPDYVKIDRHFISNIDADVVKQEFVRSMVDISSNMNCKVIAEGIETREELMLVCQLGIKFVQGYFLGRPAAIPSLVPDNKLGNCSSLIKPATNWRITKNIGSLARNILSIPPGMPVTDVFDVMNSSNQFVSLAITNDDKPLGVIDKSSMLELFSSRYGRDLYGKKPISALMRKPLIVEYDIAVEEVSKIITEDIHLDIDKDFIITKSGNYFGMGQIRDLLRAITELQMNNARYSNPLTGLPGHVPIYDRIDQLLKSNTEFRVAYCDLDSFKPYNDYYGYSRGDLLLQSLSNNIGRHIDHLYDFIGHIGGDDFVIIFQSSDWESRCNMIMKSFDKVKSEFYDDKDLKNHGITTSNRSGDIVHFPLISLSIGVVHPSTLRCDSHHAVASLAAEAKHMAKKICGNSLFVSQRRGPDISNTRETSRIINSN